MNKALAEYVRKTRLGKRLSTIEVERNSGGKISDSYVSRIERGEYANVSIDKLDALAEGLQVTPEEIHRIARGLSPEGPKEKLEILAETFDGSDLTEADWAEIEAVVRVLIEQKRSVRSAAPVRPQKKNNKG
jgi:transcriptional regulator with XRE-family HTH domain